MLIFLGFVLQTPSNIFTPKQPNTCQLTLSLFVSTHQIRKLLIFAVTLPPKANKSCLSSLNIKQLTVEDYIHKSVTFFMNNTVSKRSALDIQYQVQRKLVLILISWFVLGFFSHLFTTQLFFGCRIYKTNSAFSHN